MMDLNKIVSYPLMTAQSVVAAKSCLGNALTLKLEQPRLPLFLVHKQSMRPFYLLKIN